MRRRIIASELLLAGWMFKVERRVVVAAQCVAAVVRIDAIGSFLLIIVVVVVAALRVGITNFHSPNFILQELCVMLLRLIANDATASSHGCPLRVRVGSRAKRGRVLLLLTRGTLLVGFGFLLS